MQKAHYLLCRGYHKSKVICKITHLRINIICLFLHFIPLTYNSHPPPASVVLVAGNNGCFLKLQKIQRVCLREIGVFRELALRLKQHGKPSDSFPRHTLLFHRHLRITDAGVGVSCVKSTQALIVI